MGKMRHARLFQGGHSFEATRRRASPFAEPRGAEGGARRKGRRGGQGDQTLPPPESGEG